MDFQWNFKILLAELKHVIGGLVVYLPDVPTTDAALQVAGDFDWVTQVGDTINACRNNPSCILTQVQTYLYGLLEMCARYSEKKHSLPYYTSQIRYLNSFLSGGKRTQTRKRNPSRSRARSRSPVRAGRNATKHKA
jgi:hypothetical protein